MSKVLSRSAFVFSSMTLISRLVGFLRDMVIAHIFGATASTDAFYVAFKIPNLFRRLFAEGSFSQAFVPVLAEYKMKRPVEAMKNFINHLLGNLIFILGLTTLMGIVFAPFWVNLFAPGWARHTGQFELAVTLLRITFPYLFFISLTAFVASLLNTYQYFAIPAFTPVFLNLVMIMAALYFSHFFHPPILALGWGVFVAGIIQFTFQLPFLKKIQLRLQPRLSWKDPGVKHVLKLMLPALFGVSLAQLSILIDTLFASFLNAGSISWLYTSERLMEFPLGVFGVALSTVILPHLAKQVAANLSRDYSETLQWAIRAVWAIGLPASVGLIILAGPLIVTLFNYGKFTVLDVEMTRKSLMLFSIGIPFFMLIKILSAGFYSQQNIKTPVKISALALAINIALNFILIFPLKHAGLALASSLAAVVNAASLFFILKKNHFYQASDSSYVGIVKIILANAGMAILLFILSPPWTRWLLWSAGQRFSRLFFLIVFGMTVYILLLKCFKFRLKDLITSPSS